LLHAPTDLAGTPGQPILYRQGMPLAVSFFTLLLFQLAGEALARFAHKPVPGPVLGMVMLAVALIARRREPPEPLQQTADGLLAVLGLLFVPAGVGIVANLALLRSAWLPIAVSLVCSTLLTLMVTALLLHKMQRRRA
jgi:holin-like protein